MLEFFGTVVKGTKDSKTMANAGSAWVDVRDLAEAYVLASEKPEAGGERIIVCAGESSLFQHVGLSLTIV